MLIDGSGDHVIGNAVRRAEKGGEGRKYDCGRHVFVRRGMEV